MKSGAITHVEVWYDETGILYVVRDYGGSTTETRTLSTLVEWLRANAICENGSDN